MRRFGKTFNVLLSISILATNLLVDSRCIASESSETLEQQEARLRTNLETSIKKFGEGAFETSQQKLSLAVFLKNSGKDIEAEKLLRPTLAAVEKTNGADSLEAGMIEDMLGRVLRHQHRLAEAEFYQRKVLAIREKLLDPSDSGIATALVDLAKVLSEMPGKRNDAKALYMRALEITTKNGDKENCTYINSNLASCLIRLNEVKEAQQLYLDNLKSAQDNAKVRPDSYSILLINIGETYLREKQYDKAYKYFEEAVAILQQTNTLKRNNAAYVLRKMGRIDTIRGRYELASKEFAEALSILHDRHSDFFAKVAQSERLKFTDLIASLSNQHKVSSPKGTTNPATNSKTVGAFSKLAISIDVERKIFEKLRHDGELNITRELEQVYRERCKDLGEFGEFDPLVCEVALQIAEMLAILGAPDTKCVVDKAEPGITGFAESLLLDDTASGADPRTTVQFLGGRIAALDFAIDELIWLAYLNGQNIEDDQAKKNLELAEECLRVQYPSKTNGEPKVHSSVLNAERLLAMAETWRQLSDLQQSTRLTESALSMAIALKDNKMQYKALLQLAKSDLAESDLEPALKHAEEAKRIALSEFGATAKEIIPCERLLAEINLANGNYQEAQNCAAKALYCKDVSQSDRIFLHNMSGFAYLCQGKYEESKSQLQMSLDLCNENTTKQISDSLLFSAAATAQAEALVRLGDTKEAMRKLDWALNLDRENESFGIELTLARDYQGIARVQALEGDHEVAARYALDAACYVDNFLMSGMSQLSFAQQCSFISVTRQIRSLLLDTCIDSKNLPLAYAYIMRWEGLTLETLRSQSILSAAIANAPENTKKTLVELSKTRIKLAELTSGHEQSEPELAQLTEKKEKLEREVALQGSRLSDVLKNKDSDWFREHLKADQAFLDILTYKPSKDKVEHYALIALKAGDGGEPHFFDLGEKSVIDQQINDWRSNINQNILSKNRDLTLDRAINAASMSSEKYLKLTQSLANLFITNAKVSKFLGKDVNKIWLCPKSETAKMPWNALSIICGADNLTICEVDSPREFVQISRSNHMASNPNDRLLLAGVGAFHDDAINDLPGTGLEIRGIKEQADKAAFPCDVLLDADANKAKVREKISQASIAHLSTHGFARSEKDGSNDTHKNSNVEFGLLSFSSAIPRNPLTDSGLVLSPVIAPEVMIALNDAKSNTVSKVKRSDSNSNDKPKTDSMHKSSEAIQIAYASNLRSAGSLDSILRSTTTSVGAKKPLTNLLTAEEIVGLNLSKCKLVSLSACKTGLGTGLEGQGVIGLRSAIISAGARSILMSLWSVDDDATQQLMCKFYSSLLDPEHPLSEIEALTKAQEYIRNQPQWQSPIYWAGWVIAGDGWQTVR
ncbi:MAG: CHAT domain-containing protein [Cyanobacteria bacterium SZAS-4]|nr:CHAT domain-containing protein [Cyanobacteria bacterium SZAS-4]